MVAPLDEVPDADEPDEGADVETDELVLSTDVDLEEPAVERELGVVDTVGVDAETVGATEVVRVALVGSTDVEPECSPGPPSGTAVLPPHAASAASRIAVTVALGCPHLMVASSPVGRVTGELVERNRIEAAETPRDPRSSRHE